MAARFCPFCGFPLPASQASFCPGCGAALSGLTASAPAAPATSPSSSPTLATGSAGAIPPPPPLTRPVGALPHPPAPGMTTMPPAPVYATAPSFSSPAPVLVSASGATTPPRALPLTTLMRASGVTVAAAILLAVSAFALERAAAGGGSLFAFVYASHRWTQSLLHAAFVRVFGYSLDDTAGAQAVTQIYAQRLLLLLVAMTPIAASCSFWRAFYRLQRKRVLTTFFDAFWSCLGLFVIGLCLEGPADYGLSKLHRGVIQSQPLWPATMLAALPGLLVIVVALAALAALYGALAARSFARWPLPSPSVTARKLRDPSVFVVALLACVSQVAFYRLLDGTLMRGVPGDWRWFPLAATMILLSSALAAYVRGGPTVAPSLPLS